MSKVVADTHPATDNDVISVRRRIASLAILVVAALATIATSVASGVLNFEAHGHVWASGAQPGALDIRVEIDRRHTQDVDRIDIRVASGLGDGSASAALYGAALEESDWRLVPDASYWGLGDPMCAPNATCVREYRILLRPAGDSPTPQLVPWRISLSMQVLESYDHVKVLIGPDESPPTPGLVAVGAFGLAAFIVATLLMFAARVTSRGRMVVSTAQAASATTLIAAGVGLFLLFGPSSAGVAITLAVVGALALGLMLLRNRQSDIPRADLLALSLGAATVVMVADQIASTVAPLQIVIAQASLGFTFGVGIAQYAHISWWRVRLTGAGSVRTAVVVIVLAGLCAAGAIAQAATADARDPTPLFASGLAIALLLALRYWASRPTMLLQATGGSIAVVGTLIALALNGLNRPFFASVPPPPAALPGSVVIVLVVVVGGLLLAVFGRPRTVADPGATQRQDD